MTPIDQLTPRQKDVLPLLCDEGLTSDQAGRRLGLSGQTIKNHITAINLRCGTINIRQVCTMYGRSGHDARVCALRPERV